MTLTLHHKLSSERASLPTFMVCAGFHCTGPSGVAAISSPYKSYSRSHQRVVASLLGGLLAIALAGCGGYSSKGKTYTTGTTTTSPALWTANATNVLEFTSTALTTPGSSAAAPTLVLNSSVFAAPQGVIFDASGNLWVIDGGNTGTGGSVKPALYQFTSASLSAQQSPITAMPNLTINSSAFKFPQQTVFDTKGNLWVSDNGNNSVMEFTQAQLMAGGANLVPSIDFQSQPAFSGALGLAFDSAGNLWVTNNGTTTIFEFNAASLVPNMTNVVPYILTPNIMLSDDGHGSIQGPWGLAFDSSGNLWSSNANAPSTVVQFSKASLAATGSPTPAVTLSSNTVGGKASLNAPNGIAFDNSGDLAVISSATPFGVALYSSSQLTAGGAIAPNVFIVGSATSLNAPSGGSFGPTIAYGSTGTYGGGMY